MIYTENRNTTAEDSLNTRIFIDMDGTLAEWRNIVLNIETDEDRFRVLEILNEILLTPGYYSSLEPHENMVGAMELLAKDYDVYILSCAIEKDGEPNPSLEKLEWLKKYAPWLSKDHIIFVPDGKNKADYIPGGIKKRDYLLDDFTKNLKAFEKAGGNGIKVLNYVNGTKGRWVGSAVSISASPQEISDAVAEILQGKTIRQAHPEKSGQKTCIDKNSDAQKIVEDIGLAKD